MSTPSLASRDVPVTLLKIGNADGLILSRTAAGELADALEDLATEALERGDEAAFRRLDPLVDAAITTMATLDILHARLTGEPLATGIGQELDRKRREHAQA